MSSETNDSVIRIERPVTAGSLDMLVKYQDMFLELPEAKGIFFPRPKDRMRLSTLSAREFGTIYDNSSHDSIIRNTDIGFWKSEIRKELDVSPTFRQSFTAKIGHLCIVGSGDSCQIAYVLPDEELDSETNTVYGVVRAMADAKLKKSKPHISMGRVSQPFGYFLKQARLLPTPESIELERGRILSYIPLNRLGKPVLDRPVLLLIDKKQ